MNDVSQQFQPMPPLDPDRYSALRADIEQNGVLVPVVKDQHGRILDGHNRAAIAAELGITHPTETRTVADDEEAWSLAVTLNTARRHLNREETRALIRSVAERHPDWSDRQISRLVGCSPSTVGSVRRPEVSNLDTLPTVTREEAEWRTQRMRSELANMRDAQISMCLDLLAYGIRTSEIVAALTAAVRDSERAGDEDDMTRWLTNPILDWLLSPEAGKHWQDRPLPAEERARVLLEVRTAFAMPQPNRD